MDNKCHEIYCPWVRDSQESDHYYCLRCGTERWVNRLSLDDFWFWIFLFILAVIIAVAMG
ncbi:hypothetical protein [Phormidium nigroviride]